MENWLEIAERKWPGRPVEGAGRWAVVPLDTPTVFLHATYDTARAQVIDPRRVQIVNLLEQPKRVTPRLRYNPADQEPD
jgi:hypothetical protein